MNTTAARARFMSDGMATLTGPRLLVALYQRLLRDLDDATAAVASGAPDEVHVALVHAEDIVYELTLALDAHLWKGAGDLAQIYEWLYHQLVAANVSKDPSLIATCRAVVAPLCEAWEEAVNADAAGELSRAAAAASV
ncbi:MAG TPA: flagellar export chaperone FliS [Acidimicrobiales bacterium]